MIVLDASAAVDWLLQTSSGLQIEKRIYSQRETLHCPHLLDLEFAQVLRRLVRETIISTGRADAALRDLLALRITRNPHSVYLTRIWQHRNNLTMYDAAYVATAESLNAPLVRRDPRLSSASGHSAIIELF